MDLKLDIKILYEDNEVLVIDKPAGLMVHGDGRPVRAGGSKDKTLADWLIEKYPAIKSVGEPFVDKEGKEISRPGIVHRLDKDTSGVMIIAKTQGAYDFLKQKFSNHEVEKTYIAFVYDNFKNDEGSIDRPIGKSPKDFRLRSAASNAKGKLRDAKTNYKVIERFQTQPKLGYDVSVLEVKPETGRTHQIRVHMKAISHPVLCDRLYSPTKSCPEGLGRQALHASILALDLPGGERKEFRADLPEDLSTLLDSLRSL